MNITPRYMTAFASIILASLPISEVLAPIAPPMKQWSPSVSDSALTNQTTPRTARPSDNATINTIPSTDVTPGRQYRHPRSDPV